MAGLDLFLFVSHVAEDRRAALEVVDELERRGVPCWIAPRNIRAGRPYDDEIVDAIENSRAMLLIFSEHCNESDYIRREITVAGESQKLLIPFRIEDVPPRRGLRVRLSDLHWIDAFVSRERSIDEVIRTVDPDGALKLEVERQESDRRVREAAEAGSIRQALESRQAEEARQMEEARTAEAARLAEAEQQRQQQEDEQRRRREDEKCQREEEARRVEEARKIEVALQAEEKDWRRAGEKAEQRQEGLEPSPKSRPFASWHLVVTWVVAAVAVAILGLAWAGGAGVFR